MLPPHRATTAPKRQRRSRSLICADPELSRTDLAFNQAYWALYQDSDDTEHRQLKQEDVQFLEAVVGRCGLPRSGYPPPDGWRYRGCIKQAYEQQRSVLLRDLSGAALEEASRPVGLHIAL